MVYSGFLGVVRTAGDPGCREPFPLAAIPPADQPRGAIRAARRSRNPIRRRGPAG